MHSMEETAAAHTVSCAFHKDQIGLDTDPAIKLDCDEAEKGPCEATQKRVRGGSRGDSQGRGLRR